MYVDVVLGALQPQTTFVTIIEKNGFLTATLLPVHPD
jgi:hypothetical protein